MLCPTLNLATTPSTTPPSFLATTPLDGRRDWWHLPDLGARLILAPNATPPPIRAASSDGSQDNAPSPSPEPRRLTFQGCRSAILTSSSLAVARPPDRRLRLRDPPDSPTFPSTAASITHLLHADEKARPPLTPRPPTTRLLNKDLSKHPVDGFSAGLVDDINVSEWQCRRPHTLSAHGSASARDTRVCPRLRRRDARASTPASSALATLRPPPRCPRLRPRDARAYPRLLCPRDTARAASSPRCPPKLPDAAPRLHRVQPARQSSASRSQSGRRRHHGSLRNPRSRARSPELRWAPALAPDTMLCPTLNLATTPSTTPPSFLATTPSLDGRRDWWHLPDLGARLILAPNATPPPIRAASSDGSQDNAPSPSPEPRRLTFQGCRSAILTSSSLAVARPPDRRLRLRDPPDSPTFPSTAASITHLLHADEKARPPLTPRPPTTRLLNKDLSKHPVDGFSAGLVDDINVSEWQVTEENLAALFINCGQVVDCRMCGDPNSVLRFTFIEFTDEEGARAALNLSGTVLRYYPVSVLPSKTVIAPVNPTFLPRSDDE
uniref:RRM domain-containing protein n=1 Tax=Zea mays TaxID=4577 RepID=A0A804UAK3_MAIZE